MKRHALLALLSMLAGGLTIACTVEINVNTTPAELGSGWVAPTAEDLADAPPLVIQGQPAGYSAAGTVMRLWDYTRAINGGEHFPCYRQAVGDCVAHGLVNVINYAQAADLAFSLFTDRVFRPAHRQWIYGTSRTDPAAGAGKLGRSDGSVGRWAVIAASTRGVLPEDAAGAPPYSGASARAWGVLPGPPHEFDAVASQYKIGAYAQVRTWDDALNALANRYPFSIASNVGFEGGSKVAGGKLWLRRGGVWAHQMCVIGIDDTAVSPFDGRRGAAYVLNSWGDEAHPRPVGDEPPGGFWIDRSSLEAVLAAGDSWAVSGFDGFRARQFDLNVFMAAPGEPIDIGFDDAENPPLAVPACETCGVPRPVCGGLAAVSALGACAAGRRRRARKTNPLAA